MRGTRDHQMVQHSDVEEGQRLLETICDGTVGCAWLRVAARVVVKKDDRRGVVVQGLLGHDAGVNFAAVDGALEQVLGGDDAVAGIQEDYAKHFVRQASAAGLEEVGGVTGVGDGTLALQAALQDLRGG